MIPSRMKEFLDSCLPAETWKNRLVCENSRRYMEFNALDVERLSRMGIEVDALGPHLVVCMWDEESEIEAGGYLVVDNLAMGQPSMGGIRMLPDVNPGSIHNLARGMTLKNAAAELPYGGGKAGIVAERSLTPAEHTQVVRLFARLIKRFTDIYLPGPDVGINDADMKTIAIENGLDATLSKPAEMGGNRIDQLGAAAGGTIIALKTLIEVMQKLGSLPQFAGMVIPSEDKISILIQGFGAVGAHAARISKDLLPEAKVVGISDALGYLYDSNGLPVDLLFQMWQDQGLVTKPYYLEYLLPSTRVPSHKYSNSPNDLLRESAFCLIPAAPIANYLDITAESQPSMVVRHMGDWQVIVEGANTYSPEPSRRAARLRMERSVYRERGVLIAPDYLVNSGGVIYAAQEKLIRTPDQLRIPDEMLGNRAAVDQWLAKYQHEFTELAEARRRAGEEYRQVIIQKNMIEFIDLLVSDSDMLPSEAAEKISVRRITRRESHKVAAEIMESMPAIDVSQTIQDAALSIINSGCPILAVLLPQGELAGVLTEWDITKATAKGISKYDPAELIMSKEVISADPTDSLLDVIRKLEYHEISAMPVVSNGIVKGMISSDLLARKSLLSLLQSQI